VPDLPVCVSNTHASAGSRHYLEVPLSVHVYVRIYVLVVYYIHTHTHTRQEDLDNMTKELDMWAKDKDVQTQLLEDEKRQSEIEVDRCLRERGGRCSA